MNIRFSRLKEGIGCITPLKRLAFFFLADLLLIALSLYMSFWLRFDGAIPSEFIRKFPDYFGLALIIKVTFLAVFGMYKISWRFFGLSWPPSP
jgi:UDP-N-acetyl-D-glucosamine 4,6-dehydratase